LFFVKIFILFGGTTLATVKEKPKMNNEQNNIQPSNDVNAPTTAEDNTKLAESNVEDDKVVGTDGTAKNEQKKYGDTELNKGLEAQAQDEEK
jgi:hypothetical protein